MAPLVNEPMTVGSAVALATLTGIPVVVVTLGSSPTKDTEAPCQNLICMARSGLVVRRVAPAPSVIVPSGMVVSSLELYVPFGKLLKIILQARHASDKALDTDAFYLVGNLLCLVEALIQTFPGRDDGTEAGSVRVLWEYPQLLAEHGCVAKLDVLTVLSRELHQQGVGDAPLALDDELSTITGCEFRLNQFAVCTFPHNLREVGIEVLLQLERRRTTTAARVCEVRCLAIHPRLKRDDVAVFVLLQSGCELFVDVRQARWHLVPIMHGANVSFVLLLGSEARLLGVLAVNTKRVNGDVQCIGKIVFDNELHCFRSRPQLSLKLVEPILRAFVATDRERFRVVPREADLHPHLVIAALQELAERRHALDDFVLSLGDAERLEVVLRLSAGRLKFVAHPRSPHTLTLRCEVLL